FASGTYQNANIAIEQFKEEYPEAKDMTIFVPDSKTYSLGYGMCLVEAAKRYEAGSGFEDIINFVKGWISEIEVYFCMHTLEFARKSGRLGGLAAVVGDVLGIKPIMCVKDGKPSVYKKIRGKKAIVRELHKLAEERMNEGSIYAVLQGDTEEEARELYDMVQASAGYDSFGVFYSGPAVTINSGPEIVGIGFRSSKA
ncbi:MAG: DegV family protein, partial [Cellulosilyticaceae bacterium]